MNHTTQLKHNYDGNLETLAEDLSELRYDALAKFIHYLSNEIENDSYNDFVAGRKQLGRKLNKVCGHLFEARNELESIWKLCELHMRGSENNEF